MTFTEKTIEEFKGILAQAYCSKENEKKEVDSELLLEAEKIATAFITTALAEQKEEILKALPGKMMNQWKRTEQEPTEDERAYNAGRNEYYDVVREAIEKI